MPAAKTKKIDTNDYATLLKDASFARRTALPNKAMYGTLVEIVSTVERALKKDGWSEGIEYSLSPGRPYGYYGYSMSDPIATWMRPVTEEEIATNGPKLYKRWQATLAKAEKKRIADLQKLNKLEFELGLPITEELV